MSNPPVEETRGASATAGFVKFQPENNQYYLDQFKDDPWWPAIRNCHADLENLIPGYNISQIKEKFGGLRYYIDQGSLSDEDWSNNLDRAMNITYMAEAWVAGFEHARRNHEQAD